MQMPDRRPGNAFAVIGFGRLKGCLACRYLTDHMESLPLGIMSRIVTVNDSLLALVPLLEKKPWQRRRV